MDVNFLIGRYDAELKRKDQITSAVSFPVTILTFLGTVVVTNVFLLVAVVMGAMCGGFYVADQILKG
jgi:hypothetical protein